MKITCFFVALCLWCNVGFSQLSEIKRLQSRLPLTTDSREKDDILNRLAQLMTNRNPDSSYYYLTQAKSLAEKLAYKSGIAIAYKSYGILLTGENNYLAATYLEKSLEIYRETGDKEGESMALMNVANLLYNDDDTINAKLYLQQSYHLALAIRKDSVLSIVMNNINLHDPNFLSKQANIFFIEGRKNST